MAGLTDLTQGYGRQQISRVEAIYIHPDYHWSDNANDIALLKLATPFDITDYVRTVCVPNTTLEDSFAPGVPCEATGWGAIIDSDVGK